MEKYICTSAFPFLPDSHWYRTCKGKISLLYPHPVTQNTYKIFCIEGNLFDNAEIFNNLEEAENRINELLT